MKDLRIVVAATDFSEHGDRAVERAIELAKQSGAALHIVHIFAPPIPLATPYDLPPPDLYLGEARKQCMERLAGWEDRARQVGVEARVHLLLGPPSSGIADLALTLHADLVVVGTRGLSGIKHVLLGSVAERVVRSAPCSVLVVREVETDGS